ncbi:hypothetical protein ACU686_20405 [Yinghuangia aomiensis]
MPVALRTAGKVALPLGVAALAAGAITYGPAAFADDSDPKLPVLTADQVVAKIAGAKTETLSGTVDLTTDLGLPALPGRGSADPSGLVSGTHTLRVAVDGPDRQRIGIRADLAEYNIVHNGRDVWTYDSRRNAATHTLLPEQQAGQAGQAKAPGTALPGAAITPQDAAAKLLDLAKQSGTTVTTAGTDKVAGRSAYKLRLAPAQPGSLLAGATLWADAETGVPLRARRGHREGRQARPRRRLHRRVVREARGRHLRLRRRPAPRSTGRTPPRTTPPRTPRSRSTSPSSPPESAAPNRRRTAKAGTPWSNSGCPPGSPPSRPHRSRRPAARTRPRTRRRPRRTGPGSPIC